MLEIVFRSLAKADLEAIAAYTKSEWGEAQAKQYSLEFRRQIDLAASFPGIGSDAFGLPRMYRKLRCGHHRVIYRYDQTHLTVVRILHEREDVPDDIEDFW